MKWFETKAFNSTASTSQKHRLFVSEPMSEKHVSALAGIKDVLARRLAQEGYDKAYVVLGQFLVLKMNKKLFVDWIMDICGANAWQAECCYTCLHDWCEAFL
ncbi:Barrier-to-autointegration factor B [Lamellibrachia satsuma]|nr:Barrier-to-autointegration factor B [Lamellibrachia satsuma]